MSSLHRLRDKLAREGVSAILLSDITNVAWSTGFSGSSGFAIVTAGDAVFVTDGRYEGQASKEVTCMRVAVYAPPTQLADFLAEQARAMGVTRLAVEAHNVSLQTFDGWKEKFAPIELSPLKDFASPLRMVKSADEVAKIVECCQIADAAFAHVLPMLKPGIAESEIDLELEVFFRRHGGVSAFESIVASGWRSALPHGRASDKLLQAGEFVTLDFGCAKAGFNSDITRTVVLGEPNARQQEIYAQVLKAQLAAIEMMKPGVRCVDVDAKAREVFDEIGIAKAFGHGLGHGLGRLVHDFGRLGTGSTEVLEPGQVWTVEPGVYFEGWGGVRIEDDVLVTDDGVRILTSSPKNLMSLPA